MSKKKTKINVDIEAINNPLVIEARTSEIVTSAADKGLFIISTIVPIILLIIKEELEWEKLCWITCIIINPLAKNWIYGTPKAVPLSSPIAKEITTKNKIDVNIGPKSVCPETIKKRRTKLKRLKCKTGTETTGRRRK